MQRDVIWSKLEFRQKRLATWLRTRHISGPSRFHLAADEVCGVLLGRNIAYYIPGFMAHYRALGMKYLIYMDNGSDDGSIDLMRGFERVIVLSNRSNFREYQPYMRMHLGRSYAEGGWRLAVDADEILRYPGERRVDLPALAGILSDRGHSGLLAQMLEMVPEGPLSDVDDLGFEVVRERFRNYSLNDISALPYHSQKIPFRGFLAQNSLSDDRVKILFGGLRRSLFAEECCLSKHVLYRPGPNVLPQPHPHVSTGLHMTDFTVALQHYKFAGGFLEREKRRQAEKRISHNATDMRLAAFAKEPRMALSVPGMQSDPTPDGLLEAGFLTASDPARATLGL
ncbi:glycosyltransferase family 2 protein [Aliiruegeria sabulilitoris]|uniref:glycosyltransferase family 2 protein n=1 Tax=Aliiruegeria sabulilitoris TaxID=1510458 RepID=UPI000835C5F2|nr:glycosyltransferase family 2 protein [Aliiruegeria sabulilitoris]NDR57072.1 glycosyltransferase family 2 protein [Pseudoruegeria sp. M32A2M]